MDAHFTTQPMEYFVDEARAEAVDRLKEYQGKTGFHFDRIRDTNPFTITARDIVAVSMLSVEVPASVSVWLLEGKGAEVTGNLLRDIEPPDVKIWDDDVNLQSDSPAWTLWNVVDGQRGMGATKTSKLLAAKRPHLLPVSTTSSVMRSSRGREERTSERDYWDLWREVLRGPDGVELRSAVEEVRREAGYDESTSILRVIDIVVWSLNRNN